MLAERATLLTVRFSGEIFGGVLSSENIAIQRVFRA